MIGTRSHSGSIELVQILLKVTINLMRETLTVEHHSRMLCLWRCSKVDLELIRELLKIGRVNIDSKDHYERSIISCVV
jgi:hypothetical protein